MLHRSLALIVFLSLPAFADSTMAEKHPERPIQALLVTGGCCHDYNQQKLILTRGIGQRINIRWTVAHQGGTTTDTKIPLYNDPNWADGFDIVVHNECFAHVRDGAFVDRVLTPHRSGTPAVLIHCAMHCYRTGDDRWFEFAGVQSPGHGPHYSFVAENVNPDHPVMQGFGSSFTAPKGELYHSVRVFDTATPLAVANRQSDGKPQVCVWANDYRGTRVFGTTIGHYNETMAQSEYLDLVSRGILWATGHEAEEILSVSPEETEAIQKLVAANDSGPASTTGSGNCCGETNAAFEKKVLASSEQEGNFAHHLTDGRLQTRWCANGAQPDEWVLVDLEEPVAVRELRLHWERREGTAYRYQIEGGRTPDSLTTLVDASANAEKTGTPLHQLDGSPVRWLKITFLGSDTGGWGSLWELEASPEKLPTAPQPVAESGAPELKDVTVPDGFTATLFGTPPDVNYPVCLTTSAAGEVFVGVDDQGSLGKEPNRGKVLRCLDTDGDGAADQINEFAKVDHPRGLVYDNGSLWVLHPPFLSRFDDTDGDGTADHQETLIRGISTEEVARRGADHTTNGIRLGIDDWIYIAVGDFGFQHAIARDGSTLSRRGGGIVRIRPDGSNMEIYSWGQRNIVDVAVDPYMNLFTRDNTNDGGGWDIRLSHVMQTAHYGYPSLYKNFTSEIMPPLADYGGGSGCGVLYHYDERWPENFRDLLFTCDWGRSEVFLHRLPANGPTFDADQESFVRIPRPTDMDTDASGRMYISSWKNGKFSYDGPNIGFVAQILPDNFVPHPVPDVKTVPAEDLVPLLRTPSSAMQLYVQREIFRRARGGALTDAILDDLATLAKDADASPASRAAAVFTIGRIPSGRETQILKGLAADHTIRGFCLRSIADSPDAKDDSAMKLFLRALQDNNERIRAEAIVGITRLLRNGSPSDDDRRQAEQQLLGLAKRAAPSPEFDGDAWKAPDPGRVVPHLATQALVRLQAVDTCLEQIPGPLASEALRVLRQVHTDDCVSGLFRALPRATEVSIQREVWSALIRLYHREGDFTEDSPKWWGTRPDTTGPYYDRQAWSSTPRIEKALRTALSEGSAELHDHLLSELKRHVVRLEGIGTPQPTDVNMTETAVSIPKADPEDPNQIANMEYASVLDRVLKANGNAENGARLFKAQSCVNCHTYADGQQPRGPHLVDIGKRYKVSELTESIVKPDARIAQGFDTWTFVTSDGKPLTGFVTLESAETVTLRKADGTSAELLQDDIEERVKQEISMMPKGIVGNLTPEQLADLIAWLKTLR